MIGALVQKLVSLYKGNRIQKLLADAADMQHKVELGLLTGQVLTKSMARL
jgi:hypothetical protein